MKVRYHFEGFVLSPSRRLLLHHGKEVSLIPRYFDLLLLLIERRNEAVSREEIFDRVWHDVIVSDGALTQAIRTIRKSLGDSSKEPRFIRTVPRHGYRFIHEKVTIESDEALADARREPDVTRPPEPGDDDQELARALEQLEAASLSPEEESEADLREAAETVLLRADAQTLRELAARHRIARAWLREARWALPNANRVPLVGQPGSLAGLFALFRLRLRPLLGVVRRRWVSASLGGALAGVAGGILGGGVLRFGPGSAANSSVLVALPLVGAVAGGLGAAGVGAGLVAAEVMVRSLRRTALLVLGGLGGGTVGGLAHLVGRFTIEGLFGRDMSPVAGGFEGLVIGAAAGVGYGLATPIPEGGMATPRGRERLRTAALTGLSCALACWLLAETGHRLGAMSLDLMAQSFPGSQVSLAPLAALLAEGEPGRLTHGAISGFEGLLFGIGLAAGMTHRPRTPS